MRITPAEARALAARCTSARAGSTPTRVAVADPGQLVAWEPPRNLQIGPFIARDQDVLLVFSVPGEPASKARARWGRYGGKPYTPESTRTREGAIGALAKHAHREVVADPMGLFSLRAGFYHGTNQARDVDNMIKLVSDALTGIVWQDDRQVVEIFGFKVHVDTPNEARTDVVVARLPGELPYTFERCEMCQRPFRIYPSWRYKRCCTRRCWGLSIRHRATVECATCGKSLEVRHFRTVANKHHFCSVACKRRFGSEEVACALCGAVYRRQKHQARRRPEPACSRSCANKMAQARRRQRLSDGTVGGGL